MHQNQYVVRVGSQWAVRAEGSKRLTGVFDTQGEAIAAGRDIAEQQRSEPHIQDRDGCSREAWSCGNDPFPPRG
ncbi:MAG: DUF2188 domain-containing protein [Verrucomicrobia bacterium]|nr:DUF2188 domain-containing protein [Verrucomicrobiota bacterium]